MRFALAATLLATCACATTPATTTTTTTPATSDLPAALQAAAVTPAMGSPHPGDRMPAFEVAAVDDPAGADVIRSSELAGKPLFLHFTATWCPYCREEIGTVAHIANETGSRGNVVLIDVKEDMAHWRQFGGVTDPALRVGADVDGKMAASFAPPQARTFLERYEVPIQGTMIVDASGVIRWYVLGDNNGYDPAMVELRALWSSLIGGDMAMPATAATVGTKPTPMTEKPHVVVTAGRATADPTGAGKLDVAVDVPAGFHIQSDKPLDSSLIATSLTLDETDVKDVVVAWPKASTFKSGDDVLSVFEGHVVAHVTFQMRVMHPNPPLAAHVVVAGKLRSQMCDAGTCYPPATTSFKAE